MYIWAIVGPIHDVSMPFSHSQTLGNVIQDQAWHCHRGCEEMHAIWQEIFQPADILVIRAESSPSANAVRLIKCDAGEFLCELTRFPEAHEPPWGIIHQGLDIRQHDAIPEIRDVLGDVLIIL
jgi:hypothetical protein